MIPKGEYAGRRVEADDVSPTSDIGKKSGSKLSEGNKQSKKHKSTGKGQG